LTLTAGYAATSTGAYTVTGTPSPTVTKTAGDAKITWNDSTKRLDIAIGLTAGTYPVTVKATNSISPDATLDFTLTVNAVTPTTYAVTVNSGTGGGSYTAGATVTITAGNAPFGKVFDKWTTTDEVSFANASSATTTFTMPAKNVTVTATYKDAPVTTFTVTYNTDGGSPATIAPVTVASGTTIFLPAAPTKSGNIFKGWKTGNTTLNAGASYTITGNVTFTAQWAKTIFSTKYEATFLNWILFFVCFGFIWMWF